MPCGAQSWWGCAAANCMDMRAWGNPELVETDDAGDTTEPQVAMDPDGSAIAVWRQSDGTRDNIWSNRFVPGQGWGNAQIIEADDAGSGDAPQVAMDPSGNAVAVWRHHDGTRYNIQANRFIPGQGWGTAEIIETDDAGHAYSPQVAMDPSGNAVAVWYQRDGTRNNIWSNRFVPGQGWGNAELIETDDAGSATSPQIAMDPSGNAVAVWSQNDGTRYNVLSNRFVPGQGWGTPALIETDNAGNIFDPQVAMDPSGNAVAVWRQSDGTRDNIWSNRFVPGQGWGSAELIEDDNAGSAAFPQIAMDPSGNAVAVWRQSDGTRDNILANRFVPGQGWGNAALIETDNTGDASTPQLAMDSSGIPVAVWRQSDGTRNNIWSNRFVPGQGWGNAELIEDDNAGSAFVPQVAMDPSGNAVAVWHQHDGTRNNIWANVLK